jgi:hypothetical protein
MEDAMAHKVNEPNACIWLLQMLPEALGKYCNSQDFGQRGFTFSHQLREPQG